MGWPQHRQAVGCAAHAAVGLGKGQKLGRKANVGEAASRGSINLWRWAAAAAAQKMVTTQSSQGEWLVYSEWPSSDVVSLLLALCPCVCLAAAVLRHCCRCCPLQCCGAAAAAFRAYMTSNSDAVAWWPSGGARLHIPKIPRCECNCHPWLITRDYDRIQLK